VRGGGTLAEKHASLGFLAAWAACFGWDAATAGHFAAFVEAAAPVLRDGADPMVVAQLLGAVDASLQSHDPAMARHARDGVIDCGGVELMEELAGTDSREVQALAARVARSLSGM